MKSKIHVSKTINTGLLFSILMLFFYGQLWAQFPQIGNDIDGEAAFDESGYSVSLSANGNILAIGARQNNTNGYHAGHVRTYEWSGSSWVQIGNDIDGEATYDYSGYSVSLSADGSILAIGGFGNDGSGAEAGHVRIFEWNGLAWIQKGNDIDGEAAGDNSGYSVNLSANGSILAVGASYNDGNGINSGHVRIYEWNGTIWAQKGNDIDGEVANDYSGSSVSLSANGNILAIGAPYNDGNGIGAGHVRIYEWNGSSWVQKGSDIDGEVATDESGWAISLNANGNILAIGAYYNNGNGNGAGHVRIYEWNGFAWLQKGSDINGEAFDDWFGYSVSLNANGSILAVGAINNDDNGSEAGHVRIYKWNGSFWVKQGADIDGEAGNNQSGNSVSLNANGDMLAVGAYWNDGNGTSAGHVRVYNLKGIYSYTYQDFNQNCIQDTLEIGLGNRTLILNPGNILLQTNNNGSWFIDSLPIGTYTLTTDNNSPIWQLTCPITQSFTITNPDSLVQAPSFGYISNYPCTEPDISIHAPRLRPGFSNQYVYVQVCNTPTASGILDSAYTIVELDPLLTVQSGSMAYTSLGNNQYQVNLGNLFPGQCVDFWLSCTLSASAILNSTLCMNAKLYPVDSCALDSIPSPYPGTPLGTVTPCTLPWDRSSLRIDAACVGDSVRFIIYNTGLAMNCYAPVRVYLDGQYILLDSIQLQGGDSIIFMFAGNGQTWRIEADQHPLHPGNSHPNATIENCGTGTWTPNLVNVLPHDDADPIIDIYCGLVTGSYDPNDKTGYPLGVGTSHDIEPNQDIEYVIRFQNTGTDTAFTVVIRDTLSMDYDVFSVLSGVSSHDYSFRMYGPRVLEWTFNNIMLPDSNVNQAGSNGFVTFKVKQKPNLPNGTVLENAASIYFDFNAPVITNTSWHTVNRNFIYLNAEKQVVVDDFQIKIYPNPTTGILNIDQGNSQEISITILDNLGRVVLQQQSNEVISSLNLNHLSAGVYYVAVNNGKELVTQKVVKW